MKLIAIVMLSLMCTQVWAGPAAWYRWRSKLTGELVCRQTSPGPGWDRAIGPFKDPRCEFLMPRH
ncbi:MAG: hypothetical protein P4L77_03110 [Sulfuriferula sp.]|nr:hypothetical protein [Sulfuriferula sp.]